MTLILALESSCDETACAIIKDGKEILSNIVSSQINVHTQYGGVVPEVASRIHIENISTVIDEALKKANLTMDDIDGTFHKPLIPINHMTGHIWANSFVADLKFPLLALVISGGHTQLVYMENDWDYKVIGTTKDDAIGEAYDKVSRVLGTGYPGGPVIDRMAKEGKEHYKLPTPKTDGVYDFSFSGLKTAVLQLIQREEKAGNEIIKEDVAYAFQETALGQLTGKTLQAIEDLKPKMLVLAGGVAANSRLRQLMTEKMQAYPNTQLVIPPMYCCTDNAAMIGAVGYVAYKHGLFGDLAAAADPGLMMPGEE